ncbi:hypothetical protein C8J57DRAFT_1598518 [Mycena rebaudengoi]|nr:hypothetical protein C8J57DRAFT_1598518 [Mycena rebaudengoi]
MKFTYRALHLCLSTFTWALLAGCFPLSAPDPCSSPGPPTYKVLVGPAADSTPLSPSPDEEYFCDPSQIKSIEAAIEAAREMAEKAAKLLQRPDAHLSEAVTTFLGKTGKPDNGIIFWGTPDSAAEKAEKCNKGSQANTINLGLSDGEGGAFENSVTFLCPVFFSDTSMFTQAKQTYQNLVKTNPNGKNNFDNPVCPGTSTTPNWIFGLMIIQAFLPILQSSDEADNLDDRYKIGDGTGLRIDPKYKQENAENVAILVAEDRFATPVNTGTAGTIGARFY